MTIKITALAASIGAAVAFMPFATQAEITVLKQDPQAGNPLSRLNFTVGGSIRPQFQNMTGNDGANGYKRNGFDGGRVSASPRIIICLMISVGLAITSWASISLQYLTGITIMRRARLIPLAVCCIPASRARRGER